MSVFGRAEQSGRRGLDLARELKERLDRIRHPLHIQPSQLDPNPVGVPAEGEGGWRKCSANPLLGGSDGVLFDVAVIAVGGVFRMWSSWRTTGAIAGSVSIDGVHWSRPRVVLEPGRQGWMAKVNRPAVVRTQDGRWHMWFTGQTEKRSSIGYAQSDDGWSWDLMTESPVLEAGCEWEKAAVMAPCVLVDQDGTLKMWYAAGEQYEPDAIGLATSTDGINWTKHGSNPIFEPRPDLQWERAKVTAPSVVRIDDWYYLFYIGFEDIGTARIGVARSRDGIRDWQRMIANPIVAPERRAWDRTATYRPAVVHHAGRWYLWYNGRSGRREQIGLATLDAADPSFGAGWDGNATDESQT